MVRARIAIFLMVTLGVELGCRSGAPAENCSFELQGLLDNKNIPPEAGIDPRQISKDMTAYTYDTNRVLTGGAYVVCEICEGGGKHRTKAIHIVYLPVGMELDTHDVRQIAEQTIMDMDVPDFKDFTPVLQPSVFSPQGSYLSREDAVRGVFLELRCRSSSCDLSKIHVRRRQFGPTKVFLWLVRDAGQTDKL